MSLETAIERINNLANLTEMKRAKAELENDCMEGHYASARTALKQAVAILKEESGG